jgi:hypothetical protein
MGPIVLLSPKKTFVIVSKKHKKLSYSLKNLILRHQNFFTHLLYVEITF